MASCASGFVEAASSAHTAAQLITPLNRIVRAGRFARFMRSPGPGARRPGIGCGSRPAISDCARQSGHRPWIAPTAHPELRWARFWSGGRIIEAPRDPVPAGERTDAPQSSDSGKLFASLYADLRSLAERQVRRSGGAVLSPTTLLHEAYLGMAERSAVFPDRERFLGY